MTRKSPALSLTRLEGAAFAPTTFLWSVADGVATITLDRPARKNALTFESYAELRDTFRNLQYADDVRAVVLRGSGDDFCSGGDVHEIIAPLVKMKELGRTDEILAFTRMTGDLVLAMRRCPQPIVAAVDGVCAGAGAILAMASDIRIGTPRARVAFLFVRVGLSGADMGACAMLPRIIGHGRASELLYTGRFMSAEEGQAWGFFSRVVQPGEVQAEAAATARELAAGPSFAHAMTKRCLYQEWSTSIEAAIEIEAEAQALCMQTGDFARAYRGFVDKQAPTFEGR
jgi:enoyl-CoA hydratase/carnithine racemase